MSDIAVHYFDGKSSRLNPARLRVSGETAYLYQANSAELGEHLIRSAKLAELRVSERSKHAVRKVTFADGAYLEIQDNASFEQVLQHTGYQDSAVVKLQQSWSGTIAALVATVAVVATMYVWLIPVISVAAAKMLPVSVERQLGDGSLKFLDDYMFLPSKLSTERQQQLRQRFAGLSAPEANSPTYQLLFRRSKIGPNAFALPSGDIVMTDELVALLKDDDAIMGVLAHEMGHLHERHLSRRLIQGSLTAAAATVLFGDVSAVLANIPTVLIDLKYSRDAENDADTYALKMLDKNRIPREPLARGFEKLMKGDEDVPAYISSHPASAERIAKIRGSQPKE